MNAPQPPPDIDAYIAALPQHVRPLVETIRTAIRSELPELEETIRYRMPTFALRGRSLLHMAAYKKHIGLYPAPAGWAELGAELAPYATGRGTLRFPLDGPLPLDLIRRVVLARAQEQAEGEAASG